MKVKELAMTTVTSTLLAVPINGRDHVWGPASAEVTLVQYGDFASQQPIPEPGVSTAMSVGREYCPVRD
jgi:hypothetical protein